MVHRGDMVKYLSLLFPSEQDKYLLYSRINILAQH
jgi:hypothetical protein